MQAFAPCPSEWRKEHRVTIYRFLSNTLQQNRALPPSTATIHS
jgi:hypothetical protein